MPLLWLLVRLRVVRRTRRVTCDADRDGKRSGGGGGPRSPEARRPPPVAGHVPDSPPAASPIDASIKRVAGASSAVPLRCDGETAQAEFARGLGFVSGRGRSGGEGAGDASAVPAEERGTVRLGRGDGAI